MLDDPKYRGISISLPPGVTVLGPVVPGYDRILTPAALAFVADLHRRFNRTRLSLLERRTDVQARLDAGERPDFLAETREIRCADWTVAPVPADLQDRRVEITGPVDRKMVINALNSGANMFMADFEDSSTPTWKNLIEGQINLTDAVSGTITHDDPRSGKHYELKDRTAVLEVRPRGWHLPEKHVLVDGEPVSGALFDFALFFFHNARTLLGNGSGPYFYLPKLESHLEARLWNDVFVHAQDALKIAQGSIKATVLIETILAAFEPHEILYELRDHSAGLNCGRWDYIFSFIKKFRNDPTMVLPDRAQVGMTAPFMHAYSQWVIQACHKRDAHAMGGMAAQIPIKSDPQANEAALAKVRADKDREVGDGHDGTWVAHPGLVPIARDIFDAAMPEAHQRGRKRHDVTTRAAELLAVPHGTKTEAGLRQNVGVGIAYLESWLRGTGCVPLHNLMEDAATAEISRTQVWQWVRHESRLDDGRAIDARLFNTVLAEETDALRTAAGPERTAAGQYDTAADLFRKMVEAGTCPEFLTLPAYDFIFESGE